jgi:hypothetical protein
LIDDDTVINANLRVIRETRLQSAAAYFQESRSFFK